MMPEVLTFEAFGPYVKRQEINFRDFRKAGLFLIHGKTGAGKTTVLDAMTYALFGESSGGGRGDITAMRSDFAAEDQDTQVSFAFQVNGKRYRFTRGVRVHVKRSGEKELQAYQSAFFMNDEGEYEPYFENPGLRNVRQKAEEILGLSYEQFRQIILLPQGKFEQLLVADSAAKEEILVTLFKAERWSEITEWLAEQALRLKREKEAEAQTVKTILEQFGCTSREELEELTAQKQKELEEQEADSGSAELAEKAVQNALQNALAVQELFDEWARALAKKKTVEAQAKEAAELEEKCRRAQSAAQLLPRRKEASALQKQMQEREKMLSDAQRKAEESRKAVSECVENLRGIHAAIQTEESLLREKEQGLKDEIKQQEQEYRRLFTAYVNDAAYMLAGELEEEKPCPVCGSTHHPKPAAQSDIKATAQEVEAAEQQVKNLQQQLAQLDKELFAIAQDMQVCGNGLKKFGQGAVGGRQRKAGRKQLASVLEEAEAAYSALKTSETSCELFAGELEKAKLAFEEAMEDFKQGCLERGFQTDEQFRSSCMTEQEIAVAREKIQQYKIEYELVQSRIKTLEEKLEGIKRPETDVLKKELKEKEEYRKAADAKAAQTKARLEMMQQAVSRLEKQERSLRKRTEEYVELDQFSRLLRGSNGVSLQRYVLGVMLTAITREANTLLSRVHDGRYQLFRTLEGVGRTRRAGLDLEVFDAYSGERRGVGSLSGGEKFLVALALSLGLSTVVQAQSGGIHIDAMFIDEGFGSLDPASIENALDVLASVRGGSRLVGIISHVELLKENIEATIEVQKGRTGSDLIINC